MQQIKGVYKNPGGLSSAFVGGAGKVLRVISMSRNTHTPWYVELLGAVVEATLESLLDALCCAV